MRYTTLAHKQVCRMNKNDSNRQRPSATMYFAVKQQISSKTHINVVLRDS